MDRQVAAHPPTSSTNSPVPSRLKLTWQQIQAYRLVVVPLGFLWVAVAFLIWETTTQHSGVFIYALDDPYIQMAIAKHLAQTGVWGIRADQFASASSSLLWPLLIASIYIWTGPGILVPLLLNLVTGSLLVVLVYSVVRARGIGQFASIAVTCTLSFATPLPALILSGQEHILHTVFTIALMMLAARELARPEQSSGVWQPSLLLLGALVTSTRYEGLFLIAIICVLLAVRHRYRRALSLGVVSMLPLLIFGGISLWLGWHLLPSSVLLKGYWPTSSSVLDLVTAIASRYNRFARQAPTLVVLVLGNLLPIFRRYRRSRLQSETKFLIGIYVAIVVLHLTSADVGWFFRYEAYLIASGILVLTLTLHDLLRSSRATSKSRKRAAIWAAVGILAYIPFAVRGTAAWFGTPRAVANIYEQQIQMAHFIGTYYQGDSVALNDIGAVSFFTDAKVVDLWGLANRDIANARLTDTYTPKVIARVVAQNHAPIALIYDSWFFQFGGAPSTWIAVGRWQIDDLYIAGADTITLYATSPNDVAYLRASLQAFSACLPRTVRQTGIYTSYTAAHSCSTFKDLK